MDSLSVLLLGDDRVALELIKNGLTSDPAGIAVSVAETAADGIGHLGEHPADCIISSWQLPDMLATDLLARLKEGWPHLPVILIPEHHDDGIVELATSGGAYDVIPREKVLENVGLVGGFVRHAVRQAREEALRAKAQTALREEKGKLAGILDSFGDGIILQDTDYKILFQNKANIKMIGEHFGEDCFRAFEGRDTLCESCPIEDAMKDGGVHREEKSVQTPMGELHVELTGSVIRDVAGKPVAGVKVVRDITRHKQFERQKTGLIEMLSHDMKTPLTTMIAYAELISTEKKDDPDPSVVEMADAIRRSGDKLLGMIENFLALSRLESGEGAMHKEPVAVAPMLADVAGMFAGLAASKSATISVEADALLPKAELDRSGVERAVSNLVKNAIEHTPAGGGITMRAGSYVDEIGGGLIISVSDTGPGIPESDIARVFDKYYRSTSSRKSRGSGLGLAIVKAVAEAHGGSAELISGSTGSTFSIYLPSGDKRPG